MMPTIVVVVAVAVLVAALLVFAAWAYQTANRLDRLHVRYDLSWQALDGALARRAVVARAVAANVFGGATQADAAAARHLAALADAAERAPRQAREACENQLSAALATVDPASLPAGLIAELADAEARVLLARRFHNDAVRDTLALRERSLVRLLRLGGTAALPSYFEIAERADALRQDDPSAADRRTSARVVLLDESGAVLLLCGSDPAAPEGTAPRWWFTVGGQVGDGESLCQAAVRELAEETGLRVDPADMIGPIWRRDAVFDFNGAEIDSEEFFFVYRTRRFEPSTAGRTDLENRYIHCHRWCDAADIEELAGAGETVYPLQLSELLTEAAAQASAPDRPRQLQSIR
jgi:8-oxo-dGTP pyrophosphatase MutT (NUDIX family)